jgi:natural product biosynthesis luciferase-like monooxygenase protein
MNLNQLLTDLSNKGIKLWLEGDQLRLRAPKGALSKELRQTLAKSKQDLIALLRQKRETPDLSGQEELMEAANQADSPASQQGMQFSLFYFSSNEAGFEEDKYRLLIEGAKFADEHGFTSVWIPERHFHAFGGLYPNPSVLGAAVAMITKRVRIRAGSVVLPLNNPVRVAENWAVVDNLSQGRVDIAIARGWNPNDYVLAPDNYATRSEVLVSGIEMMKKLWQGQSISLPNGVGKETEFKIYPLPKQRELCLWMTCSGGKERFIEAGAQELNILTALLFQPLEELGEKLAAYRESRAKHGYDAESGHVTLMLHTFVGEEMSDVRKKVRQPFTDYLKSSVNLWRQEQKNLEELSLAQQNELLSYAFERYFQRSALFGTPESALKLINRLKAIGVDEIACLIDFGVDFESVMTGLHSLKRLQELANVSGSTPSGSL